MASASQDDDDEITGINVTPLVDVMLVLLIIFMATTTYLVQKEIVVTLPKAESGASSETSVANDAQILFSIDKDNQLFVDKRKIDFPEIQAIIQTARSKIQNPSSKSALQISINADIATHHGTVVKLMDELRKNGVTDFAINVESERSDHR